MLDVEEIVERESFSIESVEQANWALRKLAAIQVQSKEINLLGQSELYRIQSWMDAEQKKLSNSAAFFESLLGAYAIKKREADPKFKKVSTPYGTVKFKRKPDKWVYEEDKLVESLKAAGINELIRVKEESNKVDLKKRAIVKAGHVIDPKTGTILDGVEVVPQPEEVVVEVSV